MSMRKEWFEEVDGGLSRFSELNNLTFGGGNGIAAAFRQLLAEDAAALELVTAVDAPEDLPTAIMPQGEVAILRGQLTASQAEVRRLEGEIDAANCIMASQRQERDSLQAKLDLTNEAVDQWRSAWHVLRDSKTEPLREYLTNKTPDPIQIVISDEMAPTWQDMVKQLAAASADLAAYRARVEAGKVVYTTDNCWYTRGKRDGQHTQALLIDVADIAPAVEHDDYE